MILSKLYKIQYFSEDHKNNEIIILDSDFSKSLCIIIELFAFMY